MPSALSLVVFAECLDFATICPRWLTWSCTELHLMTFKQTHCYTPWKDRPASFAVTIPATLKLTPVCDTKDHHDGRRASVLYSAIRGLPSKRGQVIRRCGCIRVEKEWSLRFRSGLAKTDCSVLSSRPQCKKNVGWRSPLIPVRYPRLFIVPLYIFCEEASVVCVSLPIDSLWSDA